VLRRARLRIQLSPPVATFGRSGNFVDNNCDVDWDRDRKEDD